MVLGGPNGPSAAKDLITQCKICKVIGEADKAEDHGESSNPRLFTFFDITEK